MLLQSESGTGSVQTANVSGPWVMPATDSRQDIMNVLLEGQPSEVSEYSEHLFKIGSLLYDGSVSDAERVQLEKKFEALVKMLPRFVMLEREDPGTSHLYLVVEKCFDVFVKIVTSLHMVNVATLAVRFLTLAIMSLNYWEIYNLLRWRPAIYQFLVLIKFDLSECYARFLRDYNAFKNDEQPLSEKNMKLAVEERLAKERFISRQFRGPDSPDAEEILGYTFDPDLFDDHDKFVLEQLSMGNRSFPRKRSILGHKVAAHRIVKKPDVRDAQYARNSNYDPDVVHECHLPSADEPGELCLRRFSRKYELIRHQETVHSKRKKLFKCYVCVKQDPSIGPRIFTRHDTLAKHIRVNHRISGKEAKAEVAYSKKHAEIVDESAINIPVGRRKAKGEYEFLIVLDSKKDSLRDGSDEGTIYDDFEGSPDTYDQSQDEDDMDLE